LHALIDLPFFAPLRDGAQFGGALMLRNLFSKTIASASLSLVIALFSMGSIGWAGDDYVAEITELTGNVSLRSGFGATALHNGDKLKNRDTLETGPDGTVGIVFNDHTTLSLGPDSTFTIQEFIFEPDQSRFSFIVKLFRGTASYVSGLIAKISPESARFITPSASIGIRGTKFVVRVEEI
jgi:hypothetical protein